jgi:hypothetical protein
MKASRDLAEFRSGRFAPILPEECQVNPQRYGAELAFWLCSELARQGVVTSYPNFEDWGWFIEYRADSGAEFAVECGNVGGASDHWLLGLRRFGRKPFGLDKPPFADAERLVTTIRRILDAEASVSDLEWRYSEGPAA